MVAANTTLPMPPMALRIMRDDDARLLETGRLLARLMADRGLRPSHFLLDVGSCYGRLPLGLLHSTNFHGRYVGFDILSKQVSWCSSSITPKYPNFTFKHLDVRNDRYNPKGKIAPDEVRFPAAPATVDCIALFSIFTHFYRADIEHYLREFRRVLKPGAIAVTTWFVYDAARLPAIVSAASTHPMVFELDPVTRYADETDPLRAIAFDETYVRTMIATARLEVVSIDRGTWCGEPGGPIFQDLVILRRPGGPFDHARAHLGRVKRKALRKARAVRS